MSIGGLLAVAVLLIVVVALVFKAAAPDWLDLALDGLHGVPMTVWSSEARTVMGALALAVLLTAWPLRRFAA